LAKENHLLEEEVKAKTNQFSEAQALVEGMCCEIEKLKSQLEKSKSQYENQNKEMAEMRKGIGKQVREVEILRRLLEAL
jgi:chromosome segregation ATPase